jgi:hypothetical protein
MLLLCCWQQWYNAAPCADYTPSDQSRCSALLAHNQVLLPLSQLTGMLSLRNGIELQCCIATVHASLHGRCTRTQPIQLQERAKDGTAPLILENISYMTTDQRIVDACFRKHRLTTVFCCMYYARMQFAAPTARKSSCTPRNCLSKLRSEPWELNLPMVSTLNTPC